MFIVISGLRNKLLALIRLLLAFAILAILAGQLYGLVKDAGWFYGRWVDDRQPSGNPLKVFRQPQEDPLPTWEDGDGIIQQLREFYLKD
ncbi:MAG: hypothetical protein VR69_00565 [Peptococcaceae bacterium BRH_c4b]|nr:MAG: hypothetical protein VR69_00565 [Peptococcaceae bacterium BRH_c4b]